MSGVLRIDPDGVRELAADLTAAAATTTEVVTAARADDRCGQLGGVTEAALALLEESVTELGLAGQLLRSLATTSELADAGLPAVEVDTARAEVADLLARLTASLGDAEGYRPTELDDPTAEAGDDTRLAHFGWAALYGPDGPSANDVHQGSVGDCWLLASLGALAEVDPHAITDMITDHGDGTYTVHFHDGDVVVDDQLHVSGAGPSARLTYAGGTVADPGPLWPAVIEKAQALRLGGGYADLDGDRATTAFDSFAGSSHSVAHTRPFWFDPSDDDLAGVIRDQFAARLPVSASAGGAFGMGGGHAWSVTGIDEHPVTGVTMVTVRNPWGRDGFDLDGVTGEIAYRDGTPVDWAHDDDPTRIDFGDLADGEITMPLDVFVDNFRRLDLMDPPT